MNKNEFYKQLMSEYTFDADKIRENAKRSARRQKLQPMYIGMTAAAAACVVTVGTIAAVNLGGRGGVSIQDSGLTQLSASDRLSHALEQLEQERGSSESKDFLITFSAPMSPAEAQAVLTAHTDGSLPVKQLYFADGTRTSDTGDIAKVFAGGSYQITGAAVYCSGDTAAKLQSDPAVFLVESMSQNDFDNAAPVNIDEVNTEEISIPEPAVTEPVTVTTPGSTAPLPPAEDNTGSDGTVEDPSTEEMDGTVEPEPTADAATDDSDDSEPITEEPAFPEETLPAETTGTTPGTTTPETSTPAAPAEISLPDGVTLQPNYTAPALNTYIGGDSAFFLTDNVMFVRNGDYVELYRYSPDSEKLLCSEQLEEAKVVWVSENGGKLMVTGLSSYGTRGRTLLVDAEAESITDLFTEDSVMTGVLSSASYNADSGLLVLNIRDEGMYYVSVMTVGTDGSTGYVGTVYQSDSRVSAAAMNGSTIYLLNGSGLIAVDAYSGDTRHVMSFSENPDMNRNLAFTHAAFTFSDGSVNIFDPASESLIRLSGSDTAVAFGASRHSFVNGGICYTISGGNISANGGISALAAVEYKKSFSGEYAASASGGMVHVTASAYSRLNRDSMLTFSDITESAPAGFRQVLDGAIGLNNALALRTLEDSGITKPETVSRSLEVYYSASAAQKLLAKCGIESYGALRYNNGGLSALNAADTALVISSEDGSAAEGVLYVRAGTFAGRTAYRSMNVRFVNENGFWKLDTIL